MTIAKKNARGSSAETRRARSVSTPGKTSQKVRDDKAVREAAEFYRRAVSRPDVREILEDLAKL